MSTTFNDLRRADRERNTTRRERRRDDDAEFRRVESAVYAQTAPLLSAEEESTLAERIRNGDQTARQDLILANMRLVVTIASHFKPRGMDFEDLIQEGNLGLMRATQDFDPEEHGTRFSTYASCWIRNFIMRAINGGGSMVRFPYYLVILRKRFDRMKAEMMVEPPEAGAAPSEPTMEDVAGRLGLKPRRLPFLRKAQVDCLSYSTSTLDAEEAGASEDLIFEDRPPEQPLEIAEEMERLHAALDRLPTFEAWLIRRRYRIDDHADAPRTDRRPRSRRDEEGETKRTRRANQNTDSPRTFREIELECGLRFHRLRKIEREALERLQKALSESTPPTVPFPSDPPPRRVKRRATA